MQLRLPCLLLDHPFYQQWQAGKISRQQLAQYAYAYAELVEQMPRWWEQVQEALGCDERWVVDEEREHILLWRQWMTTLERPLTVPSMADTIAALDQMSPSQLLGSLYAFEVQQPAVARTKFQGLVAHYGFDPAVLRYFEAHYHEERHVAVAESLAQEAADKEAFEHGVDRGARLFYHSLDRFL